jgi:hypothetical protein
MPTLEELMNEYRLTPKVVDLESTGEKGMSTLKTREEAATGIKALEGLMEQARKSEEAREKDVRNLVLGLPQKPERDLLAEAMVAFLPALIGYGAGRAAGGVGVAEAGISAGAQAGLTGLERMDKAREEERKRAAEQLKLRPEFKKLESESRRLGNLEKAYYDALAGGKKTTEFTTQAVKETRKKEEQVKVGAQPKPNIPGNVKLAPGDKVIVDDLARGFAGQTKVAIGLETLLKQLKDPKISSSQKIQAGLDSLKLLNSSEGKDAVGVEEAARVGRLLQFNILPNLTKPGPAFGRDLKEFESQVANSAKRARNRAAATQGEIDVIMSKYGVPGEKPKAAAPAPSPAPDQDMRAKLQKLSDAEKVEFMKATPERKKQLLEQAGKR